MAAVTPGGAPIAVAAMPAAPLVASAMPPNESTRAVLTRTADDFASPSFIRLNPVHTSGTFGSVLADQLIFHAGCPRLGNVHVFGLTQGVLGIL
jgi:hypothetical protein